MVPSPLPASEGVMVKPVAVNKPPLVLTDVVPLPSVAVGVVQVLKGVGVSVPALSVTRMP